MSNYGIDPFLYRGDANLQNMRRKVEHLSDKTKDTKIDFNNLLETDKSMLSNKSLVKELPSNVSSSMLSNVPTRQEVLEHAKQDPQRFKLYEAAKEFESFFVEKTFKEMSKNVPKGDLFHGGPAEEMFEEQLLTERVRELSKQAQFGLAEMMYKQLSRI